MKQLLIVIVLAFVASDAYAQIPVLQLRVKPGQGAIMIDSIPVSKNYVDSVLAAIDYTPYEESQAIIDTASSLRSDLEESQAVIDTAAAIRLSLANFSGGVWSISGNSAYYLDNVGIGLAAPASVLSIAESSSYAYSSLITSASAFTTMAHELSIHNDATNSNNSTASIFFKPGQTAASSQVNSARISAIRRGPFNTDISFMTRSTTNPSAGMAEVLLLQSSGIARLDKYGLGNITHSGTHAVAMGADTEDGDIVEGNLFFDGLNVGIGTTSPSQRLEVNGSLTSGNASLKANGSHLSLFENDAADPNDYWLHEVNGGKYNYFHRDADPGVWTLAMQIDPSGNIGIGKSATTYRLDIAGAIKADSLFGDASGLTNVPPQIMDVAQFNGTELELSLSGDAEATKVIDMTTGSKSGFGMILAGTGSNITNGDIGTVPIHHGNTGLTPVSAFVGCENGSGTFAISLEINGTSIWSQASVSSWTTYTISGASALAANSRAKPVISAVSGSADDCSITINTEKL